MKIWSQEHVFDQPWDVMTRAAWQKYPNPFNTSVVGTDVVDRRFENGVLKSHRILATEWGLPKWSVKLIGMDRPCFGSEVSVVDTENKTMTLQSKNLTFSSMLAIDEKMVYTPHPDNPQQTLLKQETIVEVNGVPLTSYMEQLIVNKISEKAQQGRKAMDWVCNCIDEEMKSLSTVVNAEVTELTSSAKKGMHTLQREFGDLADSLPTLESPEPMSSKV